MDGLLGSDQCSGLVKGSVKNEGLIAFGMPRTNLGASSINPAKFKAGILNITGNYTQTPSGTLSVGVWYSNAFGVIINDADSM